MPCSRAGGQESRLTSFMAWAHCFGLPAFKWGSRPFKASKRASDDPVGVPEKSDSLPLRSSSRDSKAASEVMIVPRHWANCSSSIAERSCVPSRIVPSSLPADAFNSSAPRLPAIPLMVWTNNSALFVSPRSRAVLMVAAAST